MQNIINKNSVIELEIKKSKFIGLSFYVSNEDEIKTILKNLQNNYSDATHICYAYVCNNQEKFNDNGEPNGTAGLPILDVIKKKELSNTLIVVVRYFGGTKLGSGGLIRAYRNCANEVISISQIKMRNKVNIYELIVSFEQYKLVSNILKELNAIIQNIEYNEKIKLLVAFPMNTIEDIKNLCEEIKYIKDEWM